MSPERIGLFVFPLLVVLNGSVQAQLPGMPVPVVENFSATPSAQAPPTAPPPAPQSDSEPGWFVGLDAFAVRPQNDFIDKAGIWADMRPYWHWTVSPQATLGYQFDEGNAFLASYRFLGASSDSGYPDSTERNTLNTHWLDLDYRATAYQLLPTVAFQWQAGCRLGILDRDSRYQSSYESYHDQSTFYGAGPHLGTSLTWYPGQEGLSFFARTDIGVLVGDVRFQSDSSYTPPAGPGFPNSAPQDYHYTKSKTQVLYNPRGELGGAWTPASRPWLSFEVGVRLDDFVQVDDHVQWATLIHNLGPFGRCTLRY